MKKTERIIQLDWLRVIAMMGVIVIHIFAKTDLVNFTKSQMLVYEVVPEFMRFAVPVFVMISGALLIPRVVAYKKTLLRCRRLLYALLVFGLPAAVLENIFNTKSVSFMSVGNAVLDIISGRSWDAFWFIYMLIGVYLILPFLQETINKSPTKTLYLCIVLFVFTAVIPSINEIAGDSVIGFHLPVDSIFLLYAVVGHLIVNVADQKQLRKLVVPAILVICVFLCCLILNFVCAWNQKSIIMSTVVVFVFSVSVFVVGMNLFGKESKMIAKVSECSFGVYLVHCYFVNFIYKFLNIRLIDFPLILSVPAMFITVLLMSIIVVMILLRIPVVKKYIL